MLRLILLLIAFVLVAISGDPNETLQIAAAAPFQQVIVARQTLAPGAEQVLSLTLDGASAATTILRLTITYPGGKTQEVLHQTLGSTVMLAWQVPHDVQGGTATFQLKTSGCGCGDRSAVTGAIDLERTVTGYFFVAE